MNGLATQTSPSRPPKRRGRAGGSGSRSSRGASGRSRGRGAGGLGSSKLASAKPINQADLSSSSPLLSDAEDTSYEWESTDEYGSSRRERFNKVDPSNRYEQLKIKREAERRLAIEQGLIDDPKKARSLSDAIHFVGTCPDMCPEYEMYQRDSQNNVEKWEIDPITKKIDRSRAVKAFHRSSAGTEQPLPSDVRPPEVLVKTLDYLFSDILEGGDDLATTHAFIRDRTRSIRQDFTVQNYRGREAIECHERIARYHILCLHALCENPNFSEQQEMEQLRKVVQSLMEFYQDNKMSASPIHLSNETEFRAYYALVFLRDHDVTRQLQTLPDDIFFSVPMKRSLRLRSLAQRSNDRIIQNNAEAAPNSFVRFFKEVRRSATFLEACVLETWFGGIRISAFKALRQALGIRASQVSQVSIQLLVKMLGFDDPNQLITFCNYLGLELVDGENGEPRAVWFKRSTQWEEPATHLHQFSRELVETKRGTLSTQAVVNGEDKTNGLKSTTSRLFAPPSVIPTPATRFGAAQPPSQITNGVFKLDQVKEVSSFTTQPKLPAIKVSETSPQRLDHKHPLSPFPMRLRKPSFLETDEPLINQGDSTINQKPHEISRITANLPPQQQPAATFALSSLPTSSDPHVVITEPPEDKVATRNLPSSSTAQVEGKQPEQADAAKIRQSLFERQEDLLHEELRRQDCERREKIARAEQKRQKSDELARRQNLERQRVREEESALLKKQKIASEEHELHKQERKKAQIECNIQYYSDEIVNTIVQEHVLEVAAEVLAIEFYRRGLLGKTIRQLKKICERSVRRKKLYLQRMAQTQNRKRLLARALSELDSGELSAASKKFRRRPYRLSIESEDVLEEILLKASEESKELWKPLDLSRIVSPYVDAVLSRGGLFRVEWNLLVLSMEDQLSNETRWLRTKFGFQSDIDNVLRIPSGTADLNLIWSAVMQFTGSIDHVGALIFVYEDGQHSARQAQSPRDLLHEVVRQTSLQSRYRHPVLVINFNDNLMNASEVARDLDLQALSQMTTSVPAFQVLTIGEFGDANLEASLRSFCRHASAIPNENMQDAEKEKKRKREFMRVLSQSATPDGIISEPKSPPKKVKNGDDSNGDAKLPKSIAALYQSILNAQAELEAGRNWREEENDNV